MTREGVAKEGLLKIISVTTQVSISRRVSLLKLHQLNDRQEARRGRRGGGGTDPHRWRWDEAWMRSKLYSKDWEIRVMPDQKCGARTTNSIYITQAGSRCKKDVDVVQRVLFVSVVFSVQACCEWSTLKLVLHDVG